MTASHAPLKVGQTLFYVPRDGRGAPVAAHGKTVTVTKIGRIWAELSNGKRCLLSDMTIDPEGFMPAGYLHLNEAEFKEKQTKVKAYQKLQAIISAAKQDSHTLEQLTNALKALGHDIT